MVWQAAMAVTFVTETMKSKAKGEAMLADSKLQREKLKYIRERQSEAYNKNKTEINRSEFVNSVNIEKARLQAESDAKSAFAGSGISGTSVNEIDAEISAEAAKAHNENIRVSEATKGDLFTQQKNMIEDQRFAVDQMPQFDASAEMRNAALSSVSSGMALYRKK